MSQVFSLLETKSAVSTRVPELFTISGAAPGEVSAHWIKCSVGEGTGQGQVLASVIPLPGLGTQPRVPRTSACRQHCTQESTCLPKDTPGRLTPNKDLPDAVALHPATCQSEDSFQPFLTH